MITNAFIDFAYFLINGIINFIPHSEGFPQAFHDAMSGLGGYVDIWSPVVPMSVLLTCITLVFSVEIGVFGFKTVKWVISHIPWIGGKG